MPMRQHTHQLQAEPPTSGIPHEAMAHAHQQESRLPSEENPEFGEIALCGVVISKAYHWVEDGHHIFRSAEFDVLAGDEDLDRAVAKFIANAEDLATTVSELERDDLTRGEVEFGLALLRRFSEAYRKVADRRQPRIQINLRRRRPHPRGGFHLSGPLNSSPRQLV